MAFAKLGLKRTNYPYAVARIQAKKGKLIPLSEYEKLLKMDVSEITRFIQESHYRAEVDELGSRFRGLDLLEAALAVNEERTYATVRKMLAGEGGEMVSLFLMRYFVADIKAVLRGKQSGASRDELLKELLIEDLDTYNVLLPLLAEDVKTLEDIMQALERQTGLAAQWARVLRKVPEGSPLPAYEDALDKAYYARLMDAAEDFSQKGSGTLRDFLRLEVDARNLQNAARWVFAGAGQDFSPYVIPGGRHLSVQTVLQLAAAPDLGAFEEVLSGTQIYEQVREGLQKARDSGRLVHFTTAVQSNLRLGLNRLAHISPMSIIPILNYVVRKRTEVVTLRTLARGKAAGLSEERLRELIQ